MKAAPRIFYIVNVDNFFLSHRLPLALEAQKEGYEVFILTRDTGGRKIIEEQGLQFINIPFERSGTNPFRDFSIIVLLTRLIRQYQPAIIHNVTIKPAIYGSIAARYAKKGTTIVNAISGLGYNFINGRDGTVQKVLKRLIGYAFKSGVNFIFQNQDDCHLYQSFGLLNNNRYQIIKGAGVDGSVFKFQEPIEKQKLEILITTRLLYDKGVMEFLEAAWLLASRWEGKAKFIIAGDIDNGNKACIPEKIISGYLKEGFIEWVGFQKDVRPFLIESDIVCLPSYREGLPKSLIEAMAIGRPIVTTDVPGCRECVDEGVNGYLVPVKNVNSLAIALEKLLSNYDLRISMGKASRHKMEAELSLEKVVSETMIFYKKLINI